MAKRKPSTTKKDTRKRRKIYDEPSVPCSSTRDLSRTPSNDDRAGEIQIILGPMFAGKSTELVRRLRRYEHANRKFMLIKSTKDTRDSGNSITTHDGKTVPAKKFSKLEKVKVPPSCSVIGIDEGQFFPDIVKYSDKWAKEGKAVIIASLDGNYRRKRFGSILTLIPRAESVVKLNAVCKVCYGRYGEAAFSKRIVPGKQDVMIGGADKYKAVCRTCYNKPHNSHAE